MDEVSRLVALGVSATEKGDFEGGLRILRCVYEAVPADKAPRGLSYMGLCVAKVEKKYKPAVDLAERALKVEFYEGAHWANLVRIYIAARNRRKAVDVLEKGLKKTRNDVALVKVREEIGYRKAPYLKFLSRRNPINKVYSRSSTRMRRHAFAIVVTVGWAIYLALLTELFFFILE